jgi:hypothetical protein
MFYAHANRNRQAAASDSETTKRQLQSSGSGTALERFQGGHVKRPSPNGHKRPSGCGGHAPAIAAGQSQQFFSGVGNTVRGGAWCFAVRSKGRNEDGTQREGRKGQNVTKGKARKGEEQRGGGAGGGGGGGGKKG